MCSSDLTIQVLCRKEKNNPLHVGEPGVGKTSLAYVQGMSGSPIIQNNRIIGAVTHVFVNNPTKGYGIFAEWMVEEGRTLTK